MNKDRILRAVIEYYKSIIAGVAGGFIVSIKNRSFQEFMPVTFLLLLMGFLSYYGVLKFEDRFSN